MKHQIKFIEYDNICDRVCVCAIKIGQIIRRLSAVQFWIPKVHSGLEVRWYAPVRTGTSLVGLKSNRHLFLADCHAGMFTLQCTKFGQLIARKIIKIVESRCVS